MKSQVKNLGPGTFLMGATFIVNLSNYGLNLILGRLLGPDGFSEANLIATLVMVLSFAAMGLQLTVAKITAEGSADVLGYMQKKVFVISMTLMVMLLGVSPLLSQFFNFRSPYSLVVLFVGVPFYFLMSISRGHFQGGKRFYKLAWTYLIEMVVRVGVTILLLNLFSSEGLETEIVAAGFLVSFFMTHIASRTAYKNLPVSKESLQPILKFLGIIALYELSQILINNSDVILVKHYFEAKEAGLYAAMALLGRAVFFATWTVVTIMFPKVIELEKQGLPHQRLFLLSLAVVGGLSLTMVLGSYMYGEVVMQLAFGSAYADVADRLWVYALLTSLFACANVFVYYNLSLEKYYPVVISLVVGGLQVVMLYFFHSSITQVLYVQLGLVSYMLIGMMVYQFVLPFVNQRIHLRTENNYYRIAKQNN